MIFLVADDYFERYESGISHLADDFSPVKRLSRRRQRLAQWMDAESFQLRRLEKTYCRTQPSSQDRLAWFQHEYKRAETADTGVLDLLMASNRLRLNSDKTQFIRVGSRQAVSICQL